MMEGVYMKQERMRESMMTSLSQHPKKRKPYTHLACTCCKEKHLKCDGGKPSCQNCVAKKLECHYREERNRRRESASSRAQRKIEDDLREKLGVLEREVQCWKLKYYHLKELTQPGSIPNFTPKFIQEDDFKTSPNHLKFSHLTLNEDLPPEQIIFQYPQAPDPSKPKIQVHSIPDRRKSFSYGEISNPAAQGKGNPPQTRFVEHKFFHEYPEHTKKQLGHLGARSHSGPIPFNFYDPPAHGGGPSLASQFQVHVKAEKPAAQPEGPSPHYSFSLKAGKRKGRDFGTMTSCGSAPNLDTNRHFQPLKRLRSNPDIEEKPPIGVYTLPESVEGQLEVKKELFPAPPPMYPHSNLTHSASPEPPSLPFSSLIDSKLVDSDQYLWEDIQDDEPPDDAPHGPDDYWRYRAAWDYPDPDARYDSRVFSSLMDSKVYEEDYDDSNEEELGPPEMESYPPHFFGPGVQGEVVHGAGGHGRGYVQGPGHDPVGAYGRAHLNPNSPPYGAGNYVEGQLQN
eukprot:TRINITY_DN11904_c0_g1_i1.p1 TRINITY_DN11904_c0_g1~~TRINITY_DN11904_c0_g1_i1.p1  ORF type:complete len:511 (-),score=78.21 TRINITY_DN11904_c0_g1_i1:25-1557(-)